HALFALLPSQTEGSGARITVSPSAGFAGITWGSFALGGWTAADALFATTPSSRHVRHQSSNSPVFTLSRQCDCQVSRTRPRDDADAAPTRSATRSCVVRVS